jgi:hypothetical protein
VHTGGSAAGSLYAEILRALLCDRIVNPIYDLGRMFAAVSTRQHTGVRNDLKRPEVQFSAQCPLAARPWSRRATGKRSMEHATAQIPAANLPARGHRCACTAPSSFVQQEPEPGLPPPSRTSVGAALKVKHFSSRTPAHCPHLLPVPPSGKVPAGRSSSCPKLSSSSAKTCGT